MPSPSGLPSALPQQLATPAELRRHPCEPTPSGTRATVTDTWWGPEAASLEQATTIASGTTSATAALSRLQGMPMSQAWLSSYGEETGEQNGPCWRPQAGEADHLGRRVGRRRPLRSAGWCEESVRVLDSPLSSFERVLLPFSDAKARAVAPR